MEVQTLLKKDMKPKPGTIKDWWAWEEKIEKDDRKKKKVMLKKWVKKKQNLT